MRQWDALPSKFFDITTRKNIFFDEKDEYKLSKTARQFIAGQLQHVRAMSAILSPTVNSYKRLVPGYEAPVYVCWGQKNRSALIRIPRYSPGREQAARAELRCPDPSNNPYLTLAVMLEAGLDGVRRGLLLLIQWKKMSMSLTRMNWHTEISPHYPVLWERRLKN